MGKNDISRGKTAKGAEDAAVEVGILCYPDSQDAAIHGLTDLFTVANRLSVERGGPRSRQLRVSHWRLDDKENELERVFDSHLQRPGKSTVLILPPSLDTEPGGQAMARHVRWINEQHEAGTIVCSVCVGAFLLAETGLLNGRSATTHWIHTETLAKRFPEVRLDTDKLLIDDGDIITAGGVMAWVDLGLSLIDRYISPTIMLAAARFFLVDPAGRQQRFYSSFAPQLGHGDKAVLKVQHWLQERSSEPVTVGAMAARGNLSERTFLRRFCKATGLTPKEYVQQLRVGKARESLEFSRLSVNEISWMVGYEDTGSFRKIFHRVMGLTPGEYRQRFGMTRT